MYSNIMTRVVCCVLSIVILASPLAAQSRPAMDPVKLKTQLLNVPSGSPLTVTSRDGSTLSGKLMAVTNEGFDVQGLIDGNIETRTLAFGDVAGLSTGPRRSALSKIVGPMMGVLSLVGTVAALTAAFK